MIVVFRVDLENYLRAAILELNRALEEQLNEPPECQDDRDVLETDALLTGANQLLRDITGSPNEYVYLRKEEQP